MITDNDRIDDLNQSSDTMLISESSVEAQNDSTVDTSTTADPAATRNTNPFKIDSFDNLQKCDHIKTLISKETLLKAPFKTLNRILEDIKWTIPFKQHYDQSLLNSRPIEYSKKLANLVSKNDTGYELYILNNQLNYSPSIETENYEDQYQKVVVIRGLLIKNNEVNHFRLISLDNTSNPFITNIIDKYEYHLIPKSSVSADDLKLLRCDDETFTDDAYFASINSSINQVLRVTIFKQEFNEQDLYPLVNQDMIKKRYLEGVQKHPNLNLSVDVIPNVTHCFRTLLRALRGAILLKEGDSIKTISLSDTVLDSQVDINLLLEKLGFSLNEEGTELIPPNLIMLPVLRESYIRRIQELIYLGRIYGKSITPNEFVSTYSFSDNLSLVFRTFNEFDKHISQTYFKNKDTNKLPFFINLSVCSYFQDELIIKCFENTVRSDPRNKIYYVDSLRHIIEYKNEIGPRKLRSYFQNLASRGELIGFNEYFTALKCLGISFDETNILDIDDDIIIAMYKDAYKNDLKNYSYFNKNLKLIQRVKDSQKLKDFINTELMPLSLALQELSIEEITEDEVVITAYEFKLDDILQSNGFQSGSDEVINLHKALLSVAVKRKSYLLLDYIEVKLPNILGSKMFSVQEAWEVLKCTLKSSDFEIITNFQKLMVEDTTGDIRDLRSCLRAISEEKKSEILHQFLKTGKIDSSLLPAEDWPSGLDNIGNTCYLNSLLQYYFCIKPLRDTILAFNEYDIKLKNVDGRKIGGRRVEELEIQRSSQFIYYLQELFYEMINTKQRCVAPSKELAYLAFLPLSQPVTFKENTAQKISSNIGVTDEAPILVSSQSPSPSEEDDDIEMIGQDASVPEASIENSMDNTSSSSIIERTSKSLGKVTQTLPISTDEMESTIEMGRQQDVTECIENVTFQIETALEPESLEDDGEQFDLIKKLFYGKIKQIITPLEPGKPQRISTERFFSLIINVGDHPKDIYDSLDTYFNEDIVNLEEGAAKKSSTICELPEVLQFHVQRVLFDRERLMAYKLLEPIPFSDTIYLDRYLDTDDEDFLRKKGEVFQWKSKIKELRDEKDRILQIDKENKISIIDNLVATKKFLESRITSDETLSINLSTILTIQQEIDRLREQLLDINKLLNELQAKVSNQFSSYKNIAYSIFAIFIHRGEASYGHYWIYIKDPKRNIFRKYNDEIVTEVPASEVFNFIEGNTATPYYIVYVKNNLKMDYIEPLKRQIQA